MKPLLLIRGGTATEHLLKELPNFPFILVDKHPKGIAKQKSLHSYQIDTSNLRNIESIISIAQTHNVSFAFTRSAYKEPNTLMAVVNNSLNYNLLPTLKVVNIFYDRFLLYNFLQSISIPTPLYQKLDNVSISDIQYPIVLKCRFTQDNKEVMFFPSKRLLEDFLLRRSINQESFIIEEYIDRPIFGCHCLVLEGKLWYTLITRWSFKKNSGKFKLRFIKVLPYQNIEDILLKITPYLNKITKTLKLINAVIAVQFFIDSSLKLKIFDIELNGGYINYEKLSKGIIKSSPHAILLRFLIYQEFDTSLINQYYPLNKHLKDSLYIHKT